LGYSQASTFIASFKRVMGLTPGAYTPQMAETLYRVS
jgi:AraC-like DNA-binding protein